MDVACWCITLGRGADQQHRRRPFISAVLLERKVELDLLPDPPLRQQGTSVTVQARNF
jgi:hypothetical protein